MKPRKLNSADIKHYYINTLARYRRTIMEICDYKLIKNLDIEGIVNFNPFMNFTGLCWTAVCAYMFANKTDADIVLKATKSQNTRYSTILHHILQLFFQSKVNISKQREQQIPQILLLKYVTPWYGLSSPSIMVCLVLSELYDVKMWDGDGFINYKCKNLLNKRLICTLSHFRADCPNIVPNFAVNKEKYVVTKFMARITQHVFGGIVCYDRPDENATIYIYNNETLAAQMVVPINFITVTILTVCNEDRLFGLNSRSHVAFYYQPIEDVRFKKHFRKWIPIEELPLPIGAATMPYGDMPLQFGQHLVMKIAKDVENVPTHIIPTIDYFNAHKSEIDKLVKKAQETDDKFYSELDKNATNDSAKLNNNLFNQKKAKQYDR